MVQQRKSWLAHPRIRTMTGIVAKNAIEDLPKCGYVCTGYVIMGEEGYHDVTHCVNSSIGDVLALH